MNIMVPARRHLLLAAALAAIATAAGCGLADPRSGPEQCLPGGYVYYLDGAGGGGLVNWSWGVRQGLQEAGYNAFGEMFSWQTGLGPLADQVASADYKRIKARELVREIAAHRQACPEDSVHLIALSAGTAVAVYALEEMPEGAMVDNVALLGASISAGHDLTRALRHVHGHVYVFTSSEDPVLGGLVPVFGTADDDPGGEAAGLGGFILPRSATAETRRLYAEKVRTIAWRPEFEESGNFGSHLGTVSPEFIRYHVAPLIMGGPPAGR